MSSHAFAFIYGTMLLQVDTPKLFDRTFRCEASTSSSRAISGDKYHVYHFRSFRCTLLVHSGLEVVGRTLRPHVSAENPISIAP